ncbi:hypothetical protein GCM10023189_17970 [Nibrella saemangeumensis]|uniref:Gliding motility-associated C-terminal domain-containing protein n=1 Tax=Nibrella saemangeumensis TaxID=1084526 RepID=A0ABP8MQI4_9BACT
MDISIEKKWIGILLLFGCLLSAKQATGNHIVGGDISMIHLGRLGQYKITVNQFWDEDGIAKSGNVDQYETELVIYVFSLRTREFMDEFTLKRTSKQNFTYDNPVCAKLQGLLTSEVRYSADVKFDVTRYADPDGYYIIWERCCRNAVINNIAKPAEVGMAFYLEFPAMLQNNKNFINSTPDFVLPNGKYACVNLPFQMSFRATDPDKDELRYRLVTPLVGYTKTGQSVVTSPQSHTTYPAAVWNPGYSDAIMIPGPVPLEIDARTGELTLRASQEGLFVFAVEVTELRNGVQIGMVRREFQLLVKECNPATPPPPIITSNDKPVDAVSFCTGGSIQLETQPDPKWSLQWQRDSINITGATSATITIREPGVYTVVKSRADICARDTTSQGVKVTLFPYPTVKLTAARPLAFCEGGSVELKAEATEGTLRWFRDTVSLDQPDARTVTARFGGMYTVEFTETGNVCPARDSLRVTVHPLPKAAILVSPQKVICDTLPVQLTADGNTGVQFAWSRNGSPWLLTAQKTVTTTLPGTYQVTVEDQHGCQATSPPFSLAQTPLPGIVFDTLYPICDVQRSVTLTASPTGGQFTGEGITGDQFVPTAAGAGRHAITYTYTDANGCRNQQTRIIAVQDDIGLSMPEEMVIVRGDSRVMPVTINTPVEQAVWSPPDGLSDPDSLLPTLNPVDSRIYTIQVVTPLGCRAAEKIQVTVMEQLLYPTAFTPNNDGTNDTWDIRGIQYLPDCDVYIFNRWGSVIFYSKGYQQPWDGTYRGERVEPGSYPFRIDTNRKGIQYRGNITVLY